MYQYINLIEIFRSNKTEFFIQNLRIRKSLMKFQYRRYVVFFDKQFFRVVYL
jgi:hypothetical protein